MHVRPMYDIQPTDLLVLDEVSLKELEVGGGTEDEEELVSFDFLALGELVVFEKIPEALNSANLLKIGTPVY